MNTTSSPHANLATPSSLIAPSTRSTFDVLSSLPTALRSEVIKSITVRSNAAVIGLGAVMSGFITLAAASFVTDEILSVAEIFTISTVFTAVLAAVIGILSFTSESQHGTLAPLLAAQPSKTVITAAKVAVTIALGALLSVVTMTASVAGGLAGGLEIGDTTAMAGAAGRATLFTVLAAVLGLGIGMIVRHGAGAIAGLLVWWLVIESLLGSFLAESTSRFLPFAAGNALVGVSIGSSTNEDLLLSVTQNALVFGGYGLIAVALGALLLNRETI